MPDFLIAVAAATERACGPLQKDCTLHSIPLQHKTLACVGGRGSGSACRMLVDQESVPCCTTWVIAVLRTPHVLHQCCQGVCCSTQAGVRILQHLPHPAEQHAYPGNEGCIEE
jgi:hypothetical protein